MAKNLWGDLTTLQRVRTPKAILEEQATFLTSATDGALVGVLSEKLSANRFIIEFNVKVPSLNNYTYTIFTVIHDIELYPVRIVADRVSVDEYMANETEFEAKIAQILSSQQIKTVLSRLLSQV